MTGRQEPEVRLTSHDFAFALARYDQADNLFHFRFNFYMVAQSMMLVSFATLATKDFCGRNLSIGIAISLLGCTLALSQLLVNWSLNSRMGRLRKQLVAKTLSDHKPAAIFQHYLKSPPNISGLIQVWIVPITFTVMWLGFLSVVQDVGGEHKWFQVLRFLVGDPPTTTPCSL